MTGPREHHRYSAFLSELGQGSDLHPLSDLQSSEAESRAVSKLLRIALKLTIDALPELVGTGPDLVLFGSFGRLDGRIGTSDIDPLVVLSGTADTAARIRGGGRILLGVMAGNHCLPFPHAAEICNDLDKLNAHPLSYPIYCLETLIGAGDELTRARRMQVLFEGRALLTSGKELVKSVLAKYADITGPLDLRRLAEEYLRFYRAFYETYTYRAGEGKGVGDLPQISIKDKIKLDLMREVSRHAVASCLCSLACRDDDTDMEKVVMSYSDTPLLLRSWNLASTPRIGSALSQLGEKGVRDFDRLWEDSLKTCGGPGGEVRFEDEERGFDQRFKDLKGRGKSGPRSTFRRHLAFATYSSLTHADGAMRALHDPRLRAELEKAASGWTLGRIPALKELEDNAAVARLYQKLIHIYAIKVTRYLTSRNILRNEPLLNALEMILDADQAARG